MEESVGPNAPSWDAETFEQWLEQMADSRDISSEEVLTQLASSLWVLDELEALIEETDLHSELPDARGQRTTTGEESADGEALSERVDDLEARLEDLEADHDALEDAISDDVDNIEEVLRYLVDRTDMLAERVSTIDDRLASFEASFREWQETQAKLADLQTTATEHGITAADCEQCGQTVQLATLARPECPTCRLPFEDVSPKDGWFGSATLVGDPEQAVSSESRPEALGEDPDDSPPRNGDDPERAFSLNLQEGKAQGDAGNGQPAQSTAADATETDEEPDSTAFKWQSE